MGLFDHWLKADHNPLSSGASEAVLAEQDATRMLEEGMAFESEGQLDEALRCYDSAIQLVPELARAHFNRGNILLDRGDAQGALDAYEKAVEFKPDSAAIHYNMGNAHLRLGHSDEGIAACRRAIELKPDFSDAYISLGAALEELKRHDEAIACYRNALKIKPDSAEVHSNLAIALMGLDRLEEAVTSFDTALALNPDYAQAHHNRGIALQDLGKFVEAVISYRLALNINPKMAEVHSNLGSALKELGNLDDAMASYSRALEINPDLADAHYNLGVCLQSIGQLEGAVACYRRALEVNSSHILARNNLGGVLGALGQYESALACFRRVIEIEPNNSDGHLNLGITLATIGQLDSAMVSYRKALAIEPDNADTHLSLGGALKDYGQFEAARNSIRRAIEIRPDNAMTHSNLLFLNTYIGDLPAGLALADARHFGDMASRLARPYTAWQNLPQPERRLRVGFVSGDLCNHPVGYFLESVLTELAFQASTRLELFAYFNGRGDDFTSQRIRACCSRWHSVGFLADEALARLIHDDGIDILIDLSGHTALNRLPVFAWKPAPLQASWLGYCSTTGVSAIDYYIADAIALPPALESQFVETIWRLPESYLCLSRPPFEIPVSVPPASVTGEITFGSFNNLTKMNDETVGLWARVLKAIPGSNLFLKSKQLGNKDVLKTTMTRYAAHGIDADRLILEGYINERNNHLFAYNRVDIALDPFPYNGVTTTAEALWMGVPVLTLAGDRFLARQGMSLLMNAGLPEWVASDPDDYVARAVSHASDLQRLATLRAGLRQQVLASPIFDAPRFARHFEAALRGMWQKWCAQNTGVPLQTEEVRDGAI